MIVHIHGLAGVVMIVRTHTGYSSRESDRTFTHTSYCSLNNIRTVNLNKMHSLIFVDELESTQF
jgi:hypothetical protein